LTDTTELIRIGRIANCSGGRLTFTTNNNFQDVFLGLRELFLILDENKVRFCKLDAIEALGKKKIICSFSDNSIVSEINSATSVFIAVDDVILQQYDDAGSELIGMDIVFGEHKIATVTDVFNNSVYDILIADYKLPDKEKMKNDEQLVKEIMIPDVDEFVISKDFDGRCINVRNIEGLLEL